MTFAEGSPDWLAEKLEVSPKLVRAALRVRYPRGRKVGSSWGKLTKDQQREIKSLVNRALLNGKPYAYLESLKESR